jgi:hypothetical protein
MPNNRMNKTIAGYHILMVLSAVDYRFNVHEDLIIRDWLVEEFPFDVNLDKQMEIISSLKPTEWQAHFDNCIEDFEAEAIEAEKHDLLKFAVDLVKADKIVTKEENVFADRIFNRWFPE